MTACEISSSVRRASGWAICHRVLIVRKERSAFSCEWGRERSSPASPHSVIIVRHVRAACLLSRAKIDAQVIRDVLVAIDARERHARRRLMDTDHKGRSRGAKTDKHARLQTHEACARTRGGSSGMQPAGAHLLSHGGTGECRGYLKRSGGSARTISARRIGRTARPDGGGGPRQRANSSPGRPDNMFAGSSAAPMVATYRTTRWLSNGASENGTTKLALQKLRHFGNTLLLPYAWTFNTTGTLPAAIDISTRTLADYPAR